MTDVDALVAALTLDEKCALTAGEDMWSTVAVERLGIPKISVTDGPSGARGPGIPGMSMAPSTCIPCGKIIVPAPKLFTSVPEASNFRMESSFESRHVFAPHRSPTQIDLPSRSTPTALVEPQVRPSGILK